MDRLFDLTCLFALLGTGCMLFSRNLHRLHVVFPRFAQVACCFPALCTDCMLFSRELHRLHVGFALCTGCMLFCRTLRRLHVVFPHFVQVACCFPALCTGRMLFSRALHLLHVYLCLTMVASLASIFALDTAFMFSFVWH